MNGMEERMKSMKKSSIDWAKGFTYPEWQEYYNKPFIDNCRVDCEPVKVDPLDVQCGGNHYKNKAIQPIEYIFANKLGFAEGNIVKYITRWKDKDGVKDLEKIKHYCDLLIAKEKGTK